MQPTKFQAWVDQFGARKLAEALTALGPETKCSVGPVYYWLRGEYEPRGKKLRGIITVAAGALTVEDIQDHFRELARRAAG